MQGLKDVPAHLACTIISKKLSKPRGAKIKSEPIPIMVNRKVGENQLKMQTNCGILRRQQVSSIISNINSMIVSFIQTAQIRCKRVMNVQF